MLASLISEPNSQDRKAFEQIAGGASIIDRVKALGASVHELRDTGRSYLAITFDQAAWRCEAGQKAARQTIAAFEWKLLPLLRASGFMIDGASTGFSPCRKFYSHRIAASTRGALNAFEAHMISNTGGND